ncbi:MAG: DUF1559 domain-containing protein [Planctomycetota bacterium]|nr:DUF1559 domain-containing protein [Planctomycetota bacterium]MDA1213174.1 DUF1559 domain-containing protein [Planctomycetota bacterium]
MSATVGGGARTNYDFCTSYYEYYYNHRWQAVGNRARPIFGTDSNSSIRDIRDGTSNTAAMAECHRAPASGSGNMWAATQHVATGLDFSQEWYGVNTDLRVLGAAYAAYTIEDGTYPWMVAGSKHAGGLHILMGDGAVRFLGQSTSRQVQHRLFWMADGATVGEF